MLGISENSRPIAIHCPIGILSGLVQVHNEPERSGNEVSLLESSTVVVFLSNHREFYSITNCTCNLSVSTVRFINPLIYLAVTLGAAGRIITY